MDWITELNIKEVPFVSFTGEVKHVKVEKGFYGIYKNLRKALFNVLQKYKPNTLRISGHSLGADVGLLLLYDISLSNPIFMTQPQLFAYGMPRIGDQDFVSEIKKISKNGDASLIFIRNINDIIAILPPKLFGYYDIPFKNYSNCFDYGNVVENHIKYEQALGELFKK